MEIALLFILIPLTLCLLGILLRKLGVNDTYTITVSMEPGNGVVPAYDRVRPLNNLTTRQTVQHLATIIPCMSGWSRWTISGSDYDLLGSVYRATGGEMKVEAYDPRYSLAKVRGSSGTCYLTSYHSCSCWDYVECHTLCAHMCFLALWLDGNTAKQLMPTEKPFDGLRIVTAGRFSKADNVKTRLAEKGAAIQTSFTRDDEVTALICGTNPAEAKLDYFKRHDLPILIPADIDKLFQPEQPKVSLIKEGSDT